MRLVGAAETASALPFPELIEALRAAFRDGVEAPRRHRHDLPGGATLLLMPAWGQACFGVKIVTVHPANAERGLPSVHASYLLADGRTGAPLAMLDGEALTARRTAAASALAASYLARPDASRLLVVGAGRVASQLPEAHACVRPIREITIWNRTPEAAERLAAALGREGLAVRTVRDLEPAVAQADIISCATLARTPLIRGGWLRPGTHLDLVGAYSPEMREADAEAVARASVFIDTDAALHEAGELAGLDPAAVRGALAALCRGEAPRRQCSEEITLFKSVGTALEDLAAAMLAVRIR